MRQAYQIADAKNSRPLAEFLAKEGRLLVPLLDLLERSETAVNEVIEVVGRATLEAILLLSAEEVAGPPRPGRAGGEIRRHGRQGGLVTLAERKMRIAKPRLRRKGPGGGAEVEVPAYAALQNDSRLGRRILEILMKGVSTRDYREVLPQAAEAMGVSRSSVSREAIDASEEVLKTLQTRRFDDLDILILYLDGLVFGEHHVLSALGVDGEGRKHVLGLVQGASENAAAATRLLEDLVARGVGPGQRRLAYREQVGRLFAHGKPVEKKQLLRKCVEEVKLAPERLEVEITYRVPEPGMNGVVAGACYLAIHDILAPYLTRRWALPRKGRRVCRT